MGYSKSLRDMMRYKPEGMMDEEWVRGVKAASVEMVPATPMPKKMPMKKMPIKPMMKMKKGR